MEQFDGFGLYDLAMLGITAYSKVVMRLATIIGFVIAAISLIVAIVSFKSVTRTRCAKIRLDYERPGSYNK